MVKDKGYHGRQVKRVKGVKSKPRKKGVSHPKRLTSKRQPYKRTKAKATRPRQP